MKRFILGSLLSCMIVNQSIYAESSPKATGAFFTGMAHSFFLSGSFAPIGGLFGNGKADAFAAAALGAVAGTFFWTERAILSTINPTKENKMDWNHYYGFFTGSAMMIVAAIAYCNRNHDQVNGPNPQPNN